jgi:uncharacterized membrane protein YfhO
MSSRKTFVWSGRTQIGLGLFAASLIYLAVAAPNAVAISFAVGTGACLALFGITGSRFWLVVVTLLMLAVSAAGLFAALLVGSYVLLPAALAQIAAIALMEGHESGQVGDAGGEPAAGRSGWLAGWSKQRI